MSTSSSAGGGKPRAPRIVQTVLDGTDIRTLVEFYRRLPGLRYPPGDGGPDPAAEDWLVLHAAPGGHQLAFHKVDELPPSTWPDHRVPQQLHLDLALDSVEDLDAWYDVLLRRGARLLFDRREYPREPLRVYAHPAGHPFCLLVELHDGA